jgi:hypothetical protein
VIYMDEEMKEGWDYIVLREMDPIIRYQKYLNKKNKEKNNIDWNFFRRKIINSGLLVAKEINND